MDLLNQSSLLIAVTSFALGFSVLARNVKNKLFIAFAVICSVISAWALSFFLEKIWASGLFYRFHLLFHVWLAPAGLVFIRFMARLHDSFSRHLRIASAASALLLSGALLLGLDSIPVIRQLVLFAPIFIAIQIGVLMLLPAAQAAVSSWPEPSMTLEAWRRSLIYLGGLVVLATSVMDHVPFMGSVVPVLGNLALTAYLFFLSQAISKQRFLNFGALFSRFLVLLALSLTLTLLYLLIFAWIEDKPALFFLDSFIVSFLILMLLDPLRTLVAYFTQGLLTKKHQELEYQLAEGRRTLASIVEPELLYRAILEVVYRTIEPRKAALFVLRADGTRFRETGGGETPREILADHAIFKHCQERHRKGELPVILAQVLESEQERSTSRTQRERLSILLQGLQALECNLLIPLVEFRERSMEVLGFVALDAPRPPEAWGTSWGLLPILFPYFQQAAQMLRSMEVYVRSRERDRLAALGEMAAGLAHEIRNPLGAIKGAAQLLNPPDSAGPESQFLGIIVEEVDRLNRVVTQFLDYSKPQLTDFNRVDIASIAEKAVALLKPSVGDRVRLEIKPGSERTEVMASAEQIQQVALNLIQNSVNATHARDQGQVTVQVEAVGYGPLREVHLSVLDNGKGIKKEHLEKLFIPFFTTSPGGTGLGLSICHKIVAAHRGRIEVSSEEGLYSKFSVVLPGI